MAILIAFIPYILPGKLGTIIESVLAIVLLIFLFSKYHFADGLIIFAFASTTYANLSTVLNVNKRQMRQKLLNNVSDETHHIIPLSKDKRRIFIDIFIMFMVSSGALIFLIWAPEIYAVIKLFIGISLITIMIQLLVRIGNYSTTVIYWLPEEEELVIISFFESRSFPLTDVEKITLESRPDILRLHPLFTFLAQIQDYTTSTGQVIRLDVPGEHIYFTPENVADWQSVLTTYIPADEASSEREVIPFWHPTNIKRLIWKGYFAATVKGISAYTGLLLILIFLDVPPYGIVIAVVCWWLFNLYISDRVLIASADATLVTEGTLFDRVQNLSRKANITPPNIYLVDSPIYNGLATGMNIGKGTIMVTTATKQLSFEAIEAIIAHEIIHVKKRDVLINQIARMILFSVVGLMIYLFYDEFVQLTEHFFLFIVVIYLIMLFFPIYTSLVAQYCEMRADYFAGEILNSREQMAGGLHALGEAQEQAMEKTIKYSQMENNETTKNRSVLQRERWFFRFIEFQIMPHPPLYFRIHQLKNDRTWQQTAIDLFKARITESIPDRLRRKNK